MYWIRSAVVILPIGVFTLIVAAFLSTEQRHLTRKNQLVFGLAEEPAGLNPLIVSGDAADKVKDYLFNSLVSYDENLSLNGELATDWKIGETATYFFGNQVQAEAAQKEVEALSESYDALHLISIDLEDNSLTAHFSEPGGEGPSVIFDTMDTEFLDLLHRVRISLKEPTARLSFADFREKTNHWGQIKRVWFESETTYEVTITGDAEHFVKGCQNYYASNALLEARIGLLKREKFLIEPHLEFTLRENVKWHDGAEFSAQDVVFTWESIMSGKWVSPKRSDFSRIHDIKIQDEHVIRVIYREPYSMVLEMWADVYVVPMHLLHGKDSYWQGHFNASPVGTGPFAFGEWHPGDSLILEKNPNYFEGEPHLDSIAFRFIADPLSLHLAFETGQTDIWQTEYQVNRFPQRDEFRVLHSPPTSYSYVGWNQRRALFQSAKVRTALAHAINVDAIIERVLDGEGTRAGSIFHPGMWFASEEKGSIPYDPNKALALLAEEGWQLNENEILQKGNQRFTFKLLTNHENDIRKDTAEFIQSDLAAIGISVEIQRLDWNVLVSEKIDTLDFDAYILGWVFGKDWSAGRRLFHSSEREPGKSNIVGLRNKDADALIKKLEYTYDRAEIKVLCDQLQRLIIKEQPYLFLYTQPEIRVMRKGMFSVRKPSQGEWIDEPIRETKAGIDHNARWWYLTGFTP